MIEVMLEEEYDGGDSLQRGNYTFEVCPRVGEFLEVVVDIPSPIRMQVTKVTHLAGLKDGGSPITIVSAKEVS